MTSFILVIGIVLFKENWILLLSHNGVIPGTKFEDIPEVLKYLCNFYKKSFILISKFDIYSIFFTLKNLAFMATITVLIDIKAAPRAGLRSMPIGYRTPAARGIAKRLYPVAQAKF